MSLNSCSRPVCKGLDTGPLKETFWPITTHTDLYIGDSNYYMIFLWCKLNPFSDTDIFIVCFSVVFPSSYDNVRDKWIPELKKHQKDTPFLLVGQCSWKKFKHSKNAMIFYSKYLSPYWGIENFCQFQINLH